MAKGIDIKLSSQADLVGFRETNEALAKMAKVSAKAGASMSNAE